jgi:hypothetical protein
VDQISGVTPSGPPTQAQETAQPPADVGTTAQQSGFGSRGRARRRARFLRKARELAYRDLGGLVFNLHRFGQRNDALVLAKLTTVGQIDSELRTLEAALGERETVTVLREAGINACPRCAAIHSSEDRFCPNCGLAMGRHADLPIAAATATPLATPTPAAAAPVGTGPPAATATASDPSQAPPAARGQPAAPPVQQSPPDVPSTTTAPASAPAPTTTSADSAPGGRSPKPPSSTAPRQADQPDATTAAPDQASSSAAEAPTEQPTEIIRPAPPES